jgi:cytosine/adenosine deaminase-related metal-dependent hydrolase
MEMVESSAVPGEKANLPARGNYVFRNASILTMDEKLGDLTGADIHVRDGEIIAIGAALDAPGAEVIDATRCLVLPGFIDTHQHLWNGLFRGLVRHYTPELGYFQMKDLLAKLYTPQNIHWAVQRTLAEALNAGITTVHNWAHNIPSPAHADANITSHASTGVRGRFSYGWAEGQADELPMNLADLPRVQQQWFGAGQDHLLHLGICVRGPETPKPEIRRDAYLAEFRTARELGLPITMHAAQMRRMKSRAIELLEADSLLGPDLQLVHCIHATADDRKRMGDSGTTLSISPLIELQEGMGFPQTSEMLDAGVLVSLSTDTVAVASCNMFAIMNATLNGERARMETTEFTSRKVVEMATIDGARDLGIDDQVGSLVPGKRADITMLRFDRTNISSLPDANWLHLLVHHAQPVNVDLVMVDGRILKRDGKLTALDEERITANTEQAVSGLMQLGGLIPG